MSEPVSTAHIEAVQAADGSVEVHEWVEVADESQAGDDR